MNARRFVNIAMAALILFGVVVVVLMLIGPPVRRDFVPEHCMAPFLGDGCDEPTETPTSRD